MANDGPKSAYELALERLRQKEGAEEAERPLTDEQKAAIAEVRSVYESKMAEREILHGDALKKARSYEAIDQLNRERAHDQEQYVRDRDKKIAEIRNRPRGA